MVTADEFYQQQLDPDSEGSLENDAPRYSCEYCGEGFNQPFDKARHMASAHPEHRSPRHEQRARKRRSAQTDAPQAPEPGKPLDAELTPSTQDFADALDAAVAMNVRSRRSLLRAFDRDPGTYNKDPDALMKLLDEYGVSYRASKQICRDLGISEQQKHMQQGGISVPGVGQVMQTPQGQIIILPQQTNTPQYGPNPNAPIILTGGGRGAGETELPEYERRILRLESTLERLIDQLSEQQRASQQQTADPANHPTVRILEPMLDQEGNASYDADGQPQYRVRYEPYDAAVSQMDMIFTRLERARSIERQVYGTPQSNAGGGGELLHEVRQHLEPLKDEVRELSKTLEVERATKTAAREAVEEYHTRYVRPLEERLGQYESAIGDLNRNVDMPPELRYKQGNLDRTFKRFDTLLEKADGFMTLQFLRQAGVSANDIAEVAKAQRTRGRPLVTEDQKTEIVNHLRG